MRNFAILLTLAATFPTWLHMEMAGTAESCICTLNALIELSNDVKQRDKELQTKPACDLQQYVPSDPDELSM